MRISTDMLYRQGISAMLEQQTRLARVQQQVASGRLHATAADDPVAMTEGLALDQRLADLERYGANAATARHRLNVEESALGGVTATLQRVRELAVQANSAVLRDEDRLAIAAELRQRLQELIGYANQDDGNGTYIFGGSASMTPPFASAAGGVTYSGDQTPRLIAVGPGRDVADGDPGSEVFQRVANGNGTFRVGATPANAGSGIVDQARLADPALWDGGTYTVTFAAGAYEVRDGANALIASGPYVSGQAIAFRGVELAVSGAPADGDSFVVAPSVAQDLFATVQGAIDALTAPGATPAARAARNNALFNVLQDVDGAADHVLQVRAQVGARLNALDAVEAMHDTLDLQTRETLSGLRDTDYAEAVTRMQQLLVSLQAAQQSFVRVQGLSLFEYLR